MRWKTSHRPDSRYIDLLAIVVILIAIGGAYVYFDRAPKTSTAAFIVPSQSVRW
jgi:hypothetical protein